MAGDCERGVEEILSPSPRMQHRLCRRANSTPTPSPRTPSPTSSNVCGSGLNANDVPCSGIWWRRFPDFTAECSDFRIISCYFKADNTRLCLNGMCEISWKTQVGGFGGWEGRGHIICFELQFKLLLCEVN